MTPIETIGLAVSERLAAAATGGGGWARATTLMPRRRKPGALSLLDVMNEPTPTPPYETTPAEVRGRDCRQAARAAAGRAARRARNRARRYPGRGRGVAARRHGLLIEHDMNLVSHSPTGSGARQRRAAGGGPARRVARDPQVKTVYLGEAGPMADLLAIEGLRAGYGEAVVFADMSLGSARARCSRYRAGTAPARPR